MPVWQHRNRFKCERMCHFSLRSLGRRKEGPMQVLVLLNKTMPHLSHHTISFLTGSLYWQAKMKVQSNGAEMRSASFVSHHHRPDMSHRPRKKKDYLILSQTEAILHFFNSRRIQNVHCAQYLQSPTPSAKVVTEKWHHKVTWYQHTAPNSSNYDF